MEKAQNELLKVADVISAMGISRSTWQKLVAQKQTPPIVKIGAVQRIRRNAFEAWLIGPEPCRLGLAGARRKHLHRRVVGKDCLGRQDMTADGIGQRFQERGGFTDPIGQSGPIEIKPFTPEDLALPVKLCLGVQN